MNDGGARRLGRGRVDRGAGGGRRGRPVPRGARGAVSGLQRSVVVRLVAVHGHVETAVQL